MNRKEFLFLIVATFIVIMIWVTSDIIHTHSSIVIDSKLQETLEDVNPNFDSNTLEKISQLP